MQKEQRDCDIIGNKYYIDFIFNLKKNIYLIKQKKLLLQND